LSEPGTACSHPHFAAEERERAFIIEPLRTIEDKSQKNENKKGRKKKQQKAGENEGWEGGREEGGGRRERERERERENKKGKIETSFGGAIIEILAA